jgi:hypothetical protein
MSASPARNDSGVQAWQGPDGTAGPPPPSSRRSTIYMAAVAIALIVVVGVFVTMFVIPRAHPHATGSNGTLLVAQGHAYDVYGGQASSVSFTATAPSTVHGSFQTTFGITIFLLTGSQYHTWIRTGNVSESQWASGDLSSGSLSIPVPSGLWNLAFIDLKTQSTSVYVTSDIVLTTP